MISGFHCEVHENCALLGCCSASFSNFLPTYQDNVLVSFSRVKIPRRKPVTLVHGMTTFIEYGYSLKLVQCALNPAVSWKTCSCQSLFFHYVDMTYSSLSSMLVNVIVKNVWLTPGKISCLLCTVMGDLGLRTAWEYIIPCECGQVYISWTGRSI
jgi:hypothetical protein